MKKRMLHFITAIGLVLSISQDVHAKIWRVNNNATGQYGENLGGTEAYPVYEQLDDVNEANIVLPGDTIHLEGSNKTYDEVRLVKRLVILGPGYFLPENLNTSTNGLQAEISYVIFNSNNTSSSSGSQLIGVYVGENNGITINVSNILIKRCRIEYTISLTYNISDVFILQNYFSGTNSSTVIGTNTNGFPTNVIFNNNIVRRALVLPNSPGYTVQECKNNVFAGATATPGIRMYVNRFQNNIITNQNSTVVLNGVSGPSNNPNISNNVSALASLQFGTSNNNIEASATNLFVNPLTVTDNGFQLKPGSPGSNNGSDGTDRGAFGGLSPVNQYTLSGLPAIPVIYEISTSGVAGPSGLPVTIKARTIK